MIEMHYDIPIQSEETVSKANQKYRDVFGDDFDFVPFKSTEEHINILIDQLIDNIEKVGDDGGWYWGDSIKVKIELEYEPEDK